MTKGSSVPAATAGRYRRGFEEVSVYASVMKLVSEHHRQGQIVIDVGCGYGAIAEAVRDLGLRYVGIDRDGDALADLQKRGFGTASADLEDATQLRAAVERVVDAPVAAITMLDTLEHVVDGDALLTELRELSSRNGDAPLVVSIPNVGHRDIVAKLLTGRWEMTETGLLDETHVRFFTDRRLATVMRRTGWQETGAADYALHVSDQHFPADLVTLAATPLAEVLRTAQALTTAHGEVNQFVRCYVPGTAAPDEAPETGRPFLSVLIRTQGKRLAPLEDALLCLAAQTDQDFEVLLLCHEVGEKQRERIEAAVAAYPPAFTEKIRLIEVAGGGRSRPLNVGIEHGRGDYVAVLDDDDIVMAHWVETFHALAREQPGRMLRCVVADQRTRRITSPQGVPSVLTEKAIAHVWQRDFSMLEHLATNLSPVCGLAFPRAAFRDLGLRVDEDLPVLEDWDLLIRVGIWCGVSASPEVTSLYRHWRSGQSMATHAHEEWEAARRVIADRIGSRPMVLDREGAGELGRLSAEVLRLREENGRLEQLLTTVLTSRSWLVTKPLRLAARAGRAARGRLQKARSGRA